MERDDDEWPANDLEEVPNCPLCGSAERSQLYTGLTDRVFFVAQGKWTLWQCATCRTAYLDPRPTEASIGRAYERYYTHQDPELPKPQSAYQRIRAALGNGYRNARYGTRLQPSTPFGNWIARLLPQLRTAIDYGYRWLPRTSRKMTVLDVGCGSGDWLEIARAAGWSVYGIEPDPVSRNLAQAKNITLWPSVHAVPGDMPRFDYVTLSHVIEHVHDPVELLRACHGLLKPGAKIYVDTPNIDAVGHQLFGENWVSLDPPRHLILFAHDSLRRAVEKAGFTNVTFKKQRPLLDEISKQSEAIANGRDPFAKDEDNHTIRKPRRHRRSSKFGPSSEYLTLIADRAGPEQASPRGGF